MSGKQEERLMEEKESKKKKKIQDGVRATCTDFCETQKSFPKGHNKGTNVY